MWHGCAAHGGALHHLPNHLADLRVKADPGRWQRRPFGAQGIAGVGDPFRHGLQRHGYDLLRLGQRGLDHLVLEQRDGHIAQHRFAMAAGTVQFSKSETVTHDSFLGIGAGSGTIEARRRPVLEPHAESQSAGGQHFLDFVERFATQIRGLEQLVLGALDQVADVENILGFEAIG